MTPTTAQRTLPFGKPILGDAEKQAVLDVLDSGMLVHGERIKQFEAAFAAFTHAAFAVGTSSCTASLHLAYYQQGIGPGDEVIVPAMTHTATAHGVALTGATPIFVDAEPRTGNIDLDQVEQAITPRTRALSVVHYLGMPVDMDRVMSIAQRHNLFVVEDCALGVGSTYRGRHVGLFGDVGCFSFYPVKHMTTAEGGVSITRHEDLARAYTLKRAFGVDRHVGERSVPGVYDVVALGFNYRMSEVHAAIGIHQIDRLPEFLRIRRANHEALSPMLENIPGIRTFESSHGEFQSSYYCHAVVLDEALAHRRTQIIEALKARGIGTSIYYPRPVPAMRYYTQTYGYNPSDYPVAEAIANRSIALPVGPHLTTDDMVYIGESLRDVIGKEAGA